MSAQQQIPKPNGKVHPVAEMFPMLPDDELDELAADIKANGQLHPIVLDKDGTLIDGRNRQEACRRAEVKPSYTALNGEDPVAFILSQNINRRHLSQGQRAILVAKCLDSKHFNNAVAREAGLSKAHISQASTILAHAPDLADTIVFSSGKFDPAYQEAKRRKEAKAQTEVDQKRLQTEDPELWAKVQDETMTVEDAMAALTAREKEEQRQAAVKQQEREIKARHLFTILGTLALGKQSPAEIAVDLLDYDKETLATMQLYPSRKLWEKAIASLQECANRWEGK